MGDSKDYEKDYEKERDEGPADPLAKVGSPDNDEDIDEEKRIATASLAEPEKDLDEAASIREQQEEIERIKSYASAASALSVPPSNRDATKKKKKWYNNLNPLRWGAIPPVPEVRTVCPETEAGFFSKLIFNWQGSLMRASSTALSLAVLVSV